MKFYFSIFVFCLFMSCNNVSQSEKKSFGVDRTFQQLSDEFLKGYLDWRPQAAVALGFHEYDGKIADFSKNSLDAELKRLRRYDQKLASIDTAALSQKMFYDYRILRLAIKNEIFNFEDFKVYSHNPMTYAGLLDVNLYIKRNYAPLEQRLRSIIAVERQAPLIVEAAKANLDGSLPKPYIETAISIAGGTVDFLKGDLLVALKEVKNDSLMSQFRVSNDSAISSLQQFISWLQKEELPRANNGYAIGTENYRKMLLYNENITLSPEKILELGLAELKKEQERFNSAARIIDRTKKPIDVYHAVQGTEHPTAESLIPDAEKHLEMIRQFLIDRNIVTMPSAVRVQVKETPQYAR
ncbi:MAG TPA: DUF885 family protein, partial [Chitinophagaceae bacterium]|nr:DUF885 family protein [Chitinophagaceae bacterium]